MSFTRRLRSFLRQVYPRRVIPNCAILLFSKECQVCNIVYLVAVFRWGSPVIRESIKAFFVFYHKIKRKDVVKMQVPGLNFVEGSGISWAPIQLPRAFSSQYTL